MIRRAAAARLSRGAGPRSKAAITAALVVLQIVVPSQGAIAQDEAVLKRGRAIAALRCARCHAVGRDDERPHAIVIPFRDLHTRFPIDMLVQAKESLVIAGHDEMPMFELSRDDMQALLAYIDSLAPAEPGYTR